MRLGLITLGGAMAMLAGIRASTQAQDKPPVISARTFTAGTARVTVTGTFSMSADVQINVPASIADGGMTWLQYGVSGGAEPNVLLTFNTESGETGIGVGRGKQGATGGIMAGEKSECTGKADVSKVLVSGSYKCVGLTSYNPSTGTMGKVDVTVVFTAKS